ncbi:PadR family transcriptional regulator [Streptomyces sp. H27-D2]|uniref:PadR family transcriptional regulator n=1 Tax=Streptomyces sp. H27-D2 TaxID=3046304 RepID=UPI002DB8C84D|nr:helix-turn-helix transcriptional regulator [Streptomyces sp. H27-D2]MEC4018642.1 helix-turn-helix transcriptional regulator [Streptomyces sp. H27-D2]
MASRPLTEAGFFVLLALLDEPRHGYGIKQEAAELSGQRLDLRVGTLYGVLDRLSAEGLVDHDRDEVHQGRLRRYYRLTRDGEQALEAESARMAANVRAAEQRLTGRWPADESAPAKPVRPAAPVTPSAPRRARPAGAGGAA